VALQADGKNQSAEVNPVVQCHPDNAGSTPPTPAAESAQRWVDPILRDAEEWLRSATQVRGKQELLADILKFVDKHYKERLLHIELDYEASRSRLQSDYERLMKARVKSAAIPHVLTRHGPQSFVAPAENALRRVARILYYRWYGKMGRVRLLHPYWAPMRRLIHIVDAAARNGAVNVLTVMTGHRLADAAADHLPGTHSQVSLAELMQGNLAKAFSRPPEFDLCLCTLGPDELIHFPDIVGAVASCMRSGGKIIGFYPNFGLGQIPMDEGRLLRSITDISGTVRIYWAGSARSALVVRRFHHAVTMFKRGFGGYLRLAMRLLAMTPSAVVANRLEAMAPEEPFARPSTDCTSMTIEVTI